jgi:hypothetical protein
VRKNSKRKIAATIAITAILVGGGGAAAIAYWSSGGTGSGSATTGTSTGITANQTSVITNITPGSAAQTLSGNFTNSNTGSVFVTSVTASIASVTKLGVPVVGCTSADYTLTGAVMTQALANQNVPAGTNVGAWTGATIAFNSTAANQDACKGATVNFAYAIS